MRRYKKDNKVREKFNELSKNKRSNNLLRRCINAFFIGGSICVVGEIIKVIMLKLGVESVLAASLLPVIMIFIGAFLTGIGVYDKIATYGGAGTLVPITGFANAMVSAAMDHKSEGYIGGVCCNMFKIAGPVLVFGVLEATCVGIIYYILLNVGVLV